MNGSNLLSYPLFRAAGRSDQESTGPSRDVDIEFDDDTFYTGYVGYAFAPQDYGQFSVDIEAAYRENAVDQLDFNNAPQVPVGDQSVFSVLVNDKYHLTQLSDRVIPFVGVGIGFAHIDADVRYGPVANIVDDDKVFAYQLLGGASVPVADGLSIVGTLRYIDLVDPELNRFGGPPPVANVALDSEYSAFGASLELSYAF